MTAGLLCLLREIIVISCFSESEKQSKIKGGHLVVFSIGNLFRHWFHKILPFFISFDVGTPQSHHQVFDEGVVTKNNSNFAATTIILIISTSLNTKQNETKILGKYLPNRWGPGVLSRNLNHRGKNQSVYFSFLDDNCKTKPRHNIIFKALIV